MCNKCNEMVTAVKAVVELCIETGCEDCKFFDGLFCKLGYPCDWEAGEFDDEVNDE